jgi:hypothetical protein
VGVGGTEASWLDINEVDDKRCEDLASRLFVMETIVAAEGNTDHLVLAVAEPSGALGASGTLGAGGWGGVSGGEAKSGGGYDGSAGRGHEWGNAEEGGGGGREKGQRGGEGRGGRPKLPSREARNLYIAPNTVLVKPGAVDAETGDYLHDALFSMLTTSDFARRRSALAKEGLAMTRSDAALEALEGMRQEEDNMVDSSREIGEFRESEGRGRKRGGKGGILVGKRGGGVGTRSKSLGGTTGEPARAAAKKEGGAGAAAAITPVAAASPSKADPHAERVAARAEAERRQRETELACQAADRAEAADIALAAVAERRDKEAAMRAEATAAREAKRVARRVARRVAACEAAQRDAAAMAGMR